ncbi:hypothetical protein D7Y11_16715 [Corallococcus sp. AB018]|uniref:5'-methylthioadenosine/S-adenosylhomocysteine nucleosidase family protein n=1 Tax=Corallococcus sp. AB018 TaxID=2316715 RepID=UPI000F85F3AD|nr:hypothetical protein [Corallococcus sp. AB018]RUO92068.1 hypothetical protein D7Y11_16715 [Corallococcus sp. AB018]
MALGNFCDVLVLTVIPVELGALQRALRCDSGRPRELENQTLVWNASVESPAGGRTYSVCLAAIGSPGPEDAAAVTADLLVRLKPRFAILAGIAAGMRGQNKIGNVLVAENVYAYERGALDVDGFVARPRVFEHFEQDFSVRQRMTAYWAQGAQPQPDANLGNFIRPTPPPGKEEEFAVHVAETLRFKPATIASGNKLFRDGKTLAEIRKKNHGQVEAGEMEGAGFCQACRNGGIPWVVVRGISDFGDSFKSDDFHLLAANAAAACTVDLLQKVVALSNSGPGWDVLETHGEYLRSRTRSVLTDNSASKPVEFSLARTSQQQHLAARLRDAGRNAEMIVVTGEPDVGKSALTAASVEMLRAESACVVALSLRDLPNTPSEFDQQLGASLSTVLGRASVASTRTVVVDGAEAALEGKREVLTHVVRAAVRNGFGVVAVTRDDGRTVVKETLAGAGASSKESPAEVIIPSLTEGEVAEIVRNFAVFERVAKEPRARWLLGRLGLVDALLRSGAYAALPNGALSEADVFAAVWGRLVRRGETHSRGDATPDGREAALVSLARRSLSPQAAPMLMEPLALASLRSDGLLLSLGPTAAWRNGDEFANDLIRDFAITRLLVTSPQERLLENAKAPRWAIRAARLACQAMLLQAGSDTERARTASQAYFDALSREHGERWADVPWEALLTLGASAHGLKAAEGVLISNKGVELARLLRIVQQRFSPDGLADELVVAPVIEFLCEHWNAVRGLPKKLTESSNQVLAAWLTGLASRREQDVPNALRARVRDELLVGSLSSRDKHLINCLGLLGPDLDSRVEAQLRGLAARAPHELYPCLENSVAPLSLAVHHPALLISLTEAYYIERREPDDDPWSYHEMFSMGIRGHQNHGLLASLAAYYYGPFWSLLCAHPREGISLVNRMLDHAARHRVVHGAKDPTIIPIVNLPGILVDLPSQGVRHFVGDENVWVWYRGTGVGPYPCVSALLAVERLADRLIASNIPVARVVELLLADCHNLAMLGLVVGLLIRHVHLVKDELDVWFANPLVWQMEFKRVTHDKVGFHVQGKDDGDVPGKERRQWLPQELSAYLVSRALIADDQATLARLSKVADKLSERAETMVGPAGAGSQLDGGTGEVPSQGPDFLGGANDAAMEAHDYLLTVQGWASTLRGSHYRIDRLGGVSAFVHELPDLVANRTAVARAEQERGNAAWRMMDIYGTTLPQSPSDSLVGDIALARSFQANPPSSGPPEPRSASVAVAAAAVQFHAAKQIALGRDDLKWAITTLTSAIHGPNDDTLISEASVYPMGMDRIAARGLPVILSIADAEVDFGQHSAVIDAMRFLMKSPLDEVRRTLATAFSFLWHAPCRLIGNDKPTCIHGEALACVRDGARYVRMGALEGGMRTIAVLGENVEKALSAVAVEDLLLSRLVGPIVATTACAMSKCCVAGEAVRLRDALFEAHQRVRPHHIEKRFRVDALDDLAIVSALLDCLPPKPLIGHVKQFVSAPSALNWLLRELATVATESPQRRQAFRRVWPVVMDIVLDAVLQEEDGSWDHPLTAIGVDRLIPSPWPSVNARNLEATMREAADGWPVVAELATRIDRWLPLAVGNASCVDALVGFLGTAPMHEQATRGLSWVAALLDGSFGEIASRSWLIVDWLERVRTSGLLGEQDMRRYQHIVDGLVGAGDARAVRLQMAIEQ